MIEFGARLSLKDNMYATLQKNVKMQKQFSEQVKRTANNIKDLGKAKVAPVIKAKDQATSIITKVKEQVKTAGKMVAKPFITVKDGATKALNKITSPIKKLGKTVAKPLVALKDRASPILSKIKGALKGIGSTTAKAMVAIKDGATAGLSKIKSMLGTLAKGVTIAVGLAGAGVTALLGGSIAEGASLQQSLGGVETLYGADAGMVTANADKAFKTAGLSANAYMEQVTSFSASLLQSLGGDTAKSAQLADQAIIDMADNANKFGTDMSMIQNAYQGFAKQNFSMLDNLKLGYGGSQEEMERLLADAKKLTGVEYNIDNLADVYSAIHVIQEEMGVTGTTAKEASSTFSGSFASLKSSVSNLFGNMALGGDITASMEQVMDSASTFLFDNALPMISNVFSALPKAIGTGIKSALPKIKEAGGTIITGLKDGIVALLPSSIGGIVNDAFGAVRNLVTIMTPVVQQIGGMFERISPVIANTFGKAFDGAGGFFQKFADAISKSMPAIENILLGLIGVVDVIMPVIGSLGGMFVELFPVIYEVVSSAISAILPILKSFGTVIQSIIPVVTDIVQTFAGILEEVFPIVSEVVVTVLDAVMPVIQSFAGLIQSALPIVMQIVRLFSSVIASIFPTIKTIFQSLGDKIASIVGVITNHMGIVQGVVETVSPIIQGAIEIIASVLDTAWNIIAPILDFAIGIFDGLLTCVDAVFPTIQAIVSDVWGILEPIFTAIADGLALVGDAVNGIADFIGDGIDTIAGWFGFAYGKDRVPYDNYPAVLHAGEKVLTRNQADQYDRAMSTRGVQIAESVKEVPRNTDTSTISAVAPQEVQEVTKASTNVTIEKLADTVVIEKEADVDKVVEGMITKFRKLVPNMT